MNWLWKLLYLVFKEQTKLRAIFEFRRRGLAAYLRVLQGSRRLIISLAFIFCVLQLMMLSLIGAVVTGFLLWDYDFAAKIEILFWTFTALFSIPALILCVALSEYVWYRLSGARKIVSDFKRAS